MVPTCRSLPEGSVLTHILHTELGRCPSIGTWVVKSAYRGTAIIKNSTPLGPYSTNMPRALWRP